MAKLSDLKQLLERARAETHGAVSPRSATKSASEREKKIPAAAITAKPKAPAPANTAKQGSSKHAVAAGKHSNQELSLPEAFADVAPLGPRNRARVARPLPAPVPKMRMHDEAAALAASKFGIEPAPGAWEIGQELEESQTFVRAGLGTDILAKLRRSHWAVQAELDLHGHTTDEARDELGDFLYAARNAGQRCVRVIHGKGLSSPNKEPVLKGKVRKWLAHWDDVLAYCEAPRHAGGSGAVLILLRGRS